MAEEQKAFALNQVYVPIYSFNINLAISNKNKIIL